MKKIFLSVVIILFTSLLFSFYVNVTPEVVLPNFGVDEKVSFGTTIGGNIPFSDFGLFTGIWNIDGRILEGRFTSFSYQGGLKIPLPFQSTLDQISQNIVAGQEYEQEQKGFFIKPYLQMTKVMNQSWQVNFVFQYKYIWFDQPKSYLIYGIGVEQKLF